MSAEDQRKSRWDEAAFGGGSTHSHHPRDEAAPVIVLVGFLGLPGTVLSGWGSTSGEDFIWVLERVGMRVSIRGIA